MNNKPKTHDHGRWYIAAALIFIALLCFTVWYARTHSVYGNDAFFQMDSTNGKWDLTGVDFDTALLRMNGETEYIPGALLTPEEFSAREGEAVIGHPEEPAATARLRIFVPDDGSVYMLAMNSIDFSERIYINGTRRQDAGTPGLTAGDSEPGFAYMYFEIQAQDGVIEIVRQGSNFVHRDNGSYAGIYIGRPETVKRHISLQTDLSSLTVGLFFALFLAHGLLFLILRSYKANLYFALLCLTWGIRSGVTGVKILGSWFPAFSWEAMFRLEYITAPVATLLILLVMRQVFQNLVPKWFVWGAGGISAAYAVVCVFLPTLPLSYTMLGFEVFFVAVVVALGVLLRRGLPRMVREKTVQREHWILLSGLLLFMFAVVHDAFYYNNIYLFGINYVLNDLALLIFAFFQMAAMFYATMRQAQEARRNALIAWESAELARKEQMLAQLDADNLRRDLELRERIIADIPDDSLVTCGDLVLNVTSGQAYLNNDDLQLTSKEFALLLYFIRHEDKIVQREILYTEIWKAVLSDRDRALESAVYRLRKKLGNCGYEIVVKRGKGYLFEKT